MNNEKLVYTGVGLFVICMVLFCVVLLQNNHIRTLSPLAEKGERVERLLNQIPKDAGNIVFLYDLTEKSVRAKYDFFEDGEKHWCNTSFYEHPKINSQLMIAGDPEKEKPVTVTDLYLVIKKYVNNEKFDK